MRVVITGATGNVGTSLVESLSLDPTVDSIVGLARRLPSWSPPKTTWVSADVRTAPLEELFEGADAVVNLAWMFQPTHDPVATWDNNVRGSERVFEAAAACGAGALVHASSVGAYRDRAGQERSDESWPTDALNTAAYGREKSYLERVLDRIACQHPLLRVVRMRPCFLFKKASASAQRRLFAGPLLPTAVLRLPLPLVPVPAGLRFQAMHTSDAAEAFRLALHEPVRGPFNIAADPPIGGDELAAALGGRPVPVPVRALRAGAAVAWHARILPASPQLVDLVAGLPLLDCSRAASELRWSPERPGTDALEELLDGLRERSSFPTPPLSADRVARWDEVVSGAGQTASPPVR
jgi:nucleoside-diphosphate-sugar epimerase